MVLWCALAKLVMGKDNFIGSSVGVNESCHTCELVMSHMWMSQVAHMNESCHTCSDREEVLDLVNLYGCLHISLYESATHCNTLQCTATHYTTLQRRVTIVSLVSFLYCTTQHSLCTPQQLQHTAMEWRQGLVLSAGMNASYHTYAQVMPHM